MGNRLGLCPCSRHEVHQWDDKPRSTHPVGHEVLDRLISPIRCDQISEVFGKILWWSTIIGIDEQWRFLQRQFFDSQTTCRRLEGKNSPGGQAPDEGLAVSRVDERLDILNFALDRVGLRIATVASTSPV